MVNKKGKGKKKKDMETSDSEGNNFFYIFMYFLGWMITEEEKAIFNDWLKDSFDPLFLLLNEGIIYLY